MTSWFVFISCQRLLVRFVQDVPAAEAAVEDVDLSPCEVGGG